MLRGCTPFSLNSVQLSENIAKLHASQSQLRTAKLKCCEAVVISVFDKYIDRNLQEPTGTPHVKKLWYWP